MLQHSKITSCSFFFALCTLDFVPDFVRERWLESSVWLISFNSVSSSTILYFSGSFLINGLRHFVSSLLSFSSIPLSSSCILSSSILKFILYNNLKKFIQTKIKNPEDVNDILQDSLYKAQKNIHLLKQNTNLIHGFIKFFEIQ